VIVIILGRNINEEARNQMHYFLMSMGKTRKRGNCIFSLTVNAALFHSQISARVDHLQMKNGTSVIS